MQITEIQDWLNQNLAGNSSKLEASAHLVTLLETLIKKGIEVTAMQLGEEAEEEDYVVAKLYSSESDSHIKCGFGGDDFFAYSDKIQHEFSTQLYPHTKLAIAVMAAHLCDVLSTESYAVSVEDEDGDVQESVQVCLLDCFKNHLNVYQPNVLSNKTLTIEENDYFGRASLRLVENEGEAPYHLLSAQRLQPDAALLMKYLMDGVYGGDDSVYTVMQYRGREEQEKLNQYYYEELLATA